MVMWYADVPVVDIADSGWYADVPVSIFKGVGNGKIDIFKELTPHSWTYELCVQGKKSHYKIKTNKHLTLSYKNYPQN